MPRIVGVDIPNDKKIGVALTYIYGIGTTFARRIISETGLDENVRARELSEDELSRLGTLIERDYVVEGQLRRQLTQNLARLRSIGCYRGIRHRRGLPVRGQRTHTNARTRKGKSRPIAGKKGVKEQLTK